MAAAAIPVLEEEVQHPPQEEFFAGRYQQSSANYTTAFGPIDSLVSVQQAAAFYSVCEDSIRLWVKRGWIRAFKPHPSSKVVRVVIADLLRVSETFDDKDSIAHVRERTAKNQRRFRARMKPQDPPANA